MSRIGNYCRQVFLAAVLLGIFLDSSAIAGELKYEMRGRRDPFVPLVGQDKPSVVKLEDVTSVDDIKLEGIAVGAGGKSMVMINGELLKENSKVGDIKIISITNTGVKLSLSGNIHDIKLPQEGGKGE